MLIYIYIYNIYIYIYNIVGESVIEPKPNDIIES